MTFDGTQDPVPPPVLADPLAGLVTGSRYEPETLRVRVSEPPLPDISAVREAMASVLDEDSELDLDSIAPAADFFVDIGGGSPKPARSVESAKPAEPATAVEPAAPATAPAAGDGAAKPAGPPTLRQVAKLPAPRAGGTA